MYSRCNSSRRVVSQTTILTVVVLVCHIINVCLSSHPPHDFFNKQDIANVETLIKSKYDANTGCFNGNLKDTHLAIATINKFKLLSSFVNSVKPNICAYAKEGFTLNKIESIYYSSAITSVLGCLPTSLSEKVVNEISSALNSDNLYDLVYGVWSVAILKKQNINIDIDDTDLTSATTAIIELLDQEYGTWFLEKNQEEGSPYFTGIALSALGQVASYLEDSSELSPVFEAIPVLLQSTDDSDAESPLFFRHTDPSISSLVTTSFLIQGLSEIAAASSEDIDIDDKSVELIASFLTSQKYVLSIEDAHAVMFGLNAVNSGAFKRPLVVTLSNTQIYATKDKDRDTDIKVKVTDIWGNPPGTARVFLVRAYQSGKEDIALLSNQEITSLKDEKNTYSFDFLAARPDPGSYVLEFRVLPTEQSEYVTITSAQRRVQVVAAVGLTDGTISVSDNADRDQQGKVYSFEQEKQLKNGLDLKSNNFLLISFKVRNTVSGRSVSVHQTFVKITNTQTKQTTFYVVPQEGQTYTLQLSVAKLGTKFGYESGDYTIELIIGDSFISTSLRWVLAKATITFESKSQQSTRAVVVDPFAPLPVIEHKFRPAALRAPEYMTNIFTLLVLIPLVLLIVAFLRFGANISNYPTRGLLPLYSLFFVGGYGSMLGLIVIYWLSLKLFTAVGYTVLLSIPTIFFGNLVLHSYAQQRDHKVKTN
eukprot:TRINITY_DN5108_c0_g1_i1.p1 TRINITY_DN5108_c0_g1~~TRINITY_DN5108_c0_g1_i1.p1  ORF type:complete len:706 (-),score=150.19 TRINITY_DN5108_c0_g1_i1:75-2192(-)